MPSIINTKIVDSQNFTHIAATAIQGLNIVSDVLDSVRFKPTATEVRTVILKQ